MDPSSRTCQNLDAHTLFQIQPTDTLPMRECKKMYTSSEDPRDPNYMSGIDRYRILNAYPNEVNLLDAQWQKTKDCELGLISSNAKHLKEQKEATKKIVAMLIKTEQSAISKYVDEHPTGASVLIAWGTAALAGCIFALSKMQN